MNFSRNLICTSLLCAALLPAAANAQRDAQDDSQDLRRPAPLQVSMTLELPGELYGRTPSPGTLTIQMDDQAVMDRDRGALHVLAFGQDLANSVLVFLRLGEDGRANVNVPTALALEIDELARLGFQLQVFQALEGQPLRASAPLPVAELERRDPALMGIADGDVFTGGLIEPILMPQPIDLHSARDDDASYYSVGSRDADAMGSR